VVTTDDPYAETREALTGFYLLEPSDRDEAKIGHGASYVYAHDKPHLVAAQQYLPDELVDARYCNPTGHRAEAALADRLVRIEELLGRGGRED
jgi:replication-associated recombination protein RarA